MLEVYKQKSYSSLYNDSLYQLYNTLCISTPCASYERQPTMTVRCNLLIKRRIHISYFIHSNHWILQLKDIGTSVTTCQDSSQVRITQNHLSNESLIDRRPHRPNQTIREKNAEGRVQLKQLNKPIIESDTHKIFWRGWEEDCIGWWAECHDNSDCEVLATAAWSVRSVGDAWPVVRGELQPGGELNNISEV